MPLTLKERCAKILDPAFKGDPLSRGVNTFLIILIILNVVSVVAETVDSVAVAFTSYFHAFDIFSVGIFTLEYLLRVWVCTLNPRYAAPITGRLRYIASPLAVVDLIAILPFYLPMFLTADLRFLRILRLFRLLLLFKMMRYSKSLNLIGKVIGEKKEELMVVFAITMAMLVLASGIIFHLEHDAQPQHFSSIPASMWWAVATMTTVGYGDVYPITAGGKVFAGFVSILGLGTFGLPVGIIAYGFIEEIQKRRSRPFNCPHCGKNIDAPIERRSGTRT